MLTLIFYSLFVLQAAESLDRTLVYIWSPSMHFSVRGLGEAQALAKKHGVQFLGLWDAAALEDEVQAVLKQLPTMRQAPLTEAVVHFPAMYWLERGVRVRPVHWGYERPAVVEQMFKEMGW